MFIRCDWHLTLNCSTVTLFSYIFFSFCIAGLYHTLLVIMMPHTVHTSNFILVHKMINKIWLPKSWSLLVTLWYDWQIKINSENRLWSLRESHLRSFFITFKGFITFVTPFVASRGPLHRYRSRVVWCLQDRSLKDIKKVSSYNNCTNKT